MTYREAQQLRSQRKVEAVKARIIAKTASDLLQREASSIDTLYKQNRRALSTRKASVRSKNKAKLSYICLEAKQSVREVKVVTKDVERSRETLQDWLSKSVNGPSIIQAMKGV